MPWERVLQADLATEIAPICLGTFVETLIMQVYSAHKRVYPYRWIICMKLAARDSHKSVSHLEG